MDYYSCVVRLAEISADKINRTHSLEAKQEFILNNFKKKIEEAVTLNELKKVIIAILEVYEKT